ncbi:dynamin family protein [Metabacillus litoralis]|uniref:dynamin family protein n=1 Tax=Metabacillus litoralis TaxID=152268 RepID=UPI001CFDB485|nr:dynamin family protein [Metabacillus litoralis]
MTAALKTNEFIQKIIKLYDQVNEKDSENARKLLEVANKLHNEKLYIAFAGHFSAGKSTMINTLLNEQILPTSPIPTSANLVLLEKGEEHVSLFSNRNEEIEITGQYSIDQIKEYCKQGDEIERISIKKPYQNLAENVVIMDTPGIDSTDAAHKLSTESMVHLADVVFYVTDYNHVQSEENLSFVKEMIDRNKYIFLIVNQIDKHVESEVSFIDFKDQIFESFLDIGLHKSDVFFTSLKKDHHQNNELENIQELITTVVTKRMEYIEINTQNSVVQIIKDSVDSYQEQLEINIEDKEQYQNLVHQLLSEKSSIEGSIESEEGNLKAIQNDITEKVESILKSANLVPYETREKVSSFIEAVEPTFKVGFLFSKTKTEQERENRKQELYKSLMKNLETQITWHFTPLLKEYIQKFDIHNSEILQQVQSFSISISDELISEALKTGASFNNQYVLTYSSDVSELIKRHSKQQVMSIFKKIIGVLRDAKQSMIDEYEHRINNCIKEISTYENILTKFKQLEDYKISLNNHLNNSVGDGEIDSDKWLKINQLFKKTTLDGISLQNNKKEKTTYSNKEKLDGKSSVGNIENRDAFISETERIINNLENIKGFKQFTSVIHDKVKSYKNRTFTVALFGAFSAGKSSFANALIGSRLLPSSPNPTTATINKIAPTTKQKEHGVVEVKLKSEEKLINEIIESIPSLKIETTTLGIVGEKLKSLKGKTVNETEQIKKYSTALHHYQELMVISDHLVVDTTTELMKDFVAKEEKACLVEEVIVYYDCPITKAGITLVDTPGADSLHKRHTDVAFQYIKKADAILYVTYYNHPFSKGDREFLRQLGRVKDSFTLDKMFFIINAIDLAQDEEEVELVKDYIRNQLLQHEISNVRLFGVSSLNILSNNINKETEFIQFKHQFEHFIKQELTNTSILSIREDLMRCLERIHSFLDAAKRDEAEKEQEKQILLKERSNVSNELNNLSDKHIISAVKQEIEELIHYLKQRLSYRFNDFFKEAFHPGVFHHSSNTQQALLLCLNDLIKTIEFELIQELQATSLRVENVIYRVMNDEFVRVSQIIKRQSRSVSVTNHEKQEIKTPTIEIEFSDEMIAKVKQSLKLFKNTKAFFEKNEKKAMSEDMSQRFSEPVSELLTIYTNEFTTYYEKVIVDIYTQFLTDITEQVTEGFEALLDLQPQNTGLLEKQKVEIENSLELLA